MSYRLDCRYFTGYKPCHFKRPCDLCPHVEPVEQRVLLISLEALGAVLRSTCLLKPLRRLYPKAHVTWLTLPNAKPLLLNNPMIDRLMTLDVATLTPLDHLEFDHLFCVDKSLEAGSLAMTIKAKSKAGFGLDRNGVIIPLNEAASYQYDVGLDDDLKFFRNQKPETQQTTESLGMTWQRDPYILTLTEDEGRIVAERRLVLRGANRGVIGYNTGCSELYPYKKLSTDGATILVRQWRQHFPDWSVALLGGREDQERQAIIKRSFPDDPHVINTPTTEGLRSGILWMDATDIVFSGCSLGMHIGIALKKPVIAWFGVSCSQEVDLYDRGVKIPSAVSCSPCWLKTCENEPKCYDRVLWDDVASAMAKYIA